MNPTELIDRLELSGRDLHRLLEHAAPEEFRWKPEPDRWSLLEILNHLIDEERDDFRARLHLTLDSPERAWPAIDPTGWVRERGYNERDIARSLVTFRREREASLTWLRGLAQPDWTRAHQHPRHGWISAGDLLTSWVAHDLLHVAQVARTRAAYLAEGAAPFSPRYAG